MEKTPKKQRKKNDKKKTFKVWENKILHYDEKIVYHKSSRKCHKKQETPFFADSKKRQSQKCRSTKKIVF